MNPNYRVNTITLVVLSDEDISGWELGRIIEECDTGCCVMADTALSVRPPGRIADATVALHKRLLRTCARETDEPTPPTT